MLVPKPIESAIRQKQWGSGQLLNNCQTVGFSLSKNRGWQRDSAEKVL